jgi:uncharacterized protein (TIGR02147 family)
MSAAVFDFDDYKEFLRHAVEAGPTGALSRLAEAAGCQRSYLSDVLRREVQLTPDHAYGIARHLRLEPAAADYFLDLVHLARAATPSYRAKLATSLEARRQDHRRLTQRLAPAKTQEADARYYASWHYGALHVATAVPGLDTVEALARRFRLPTAEVARLLAELVEAGYVRQAGARFSYDTERPLRHLSDGSPLSRLNHGNWRSLAQSRLARYEADVHYSVVFAVERKTYDELRAQLLTFIEEQRATISRSGSEDVVCFTCDLFSV